MMQWTQIPSSIIGMLLCTHNQLAQWLLFSVVCLARPDQLNCYTSFYQQIYSMHKIHHLLNIYCYKILMLFTALTTDSDVDFCCWICVLDSFLLHCLSSWSSSKRTYIATNHSYIVLKKISGCRSFILAWSYWQIITTNRNLQINIYTSTDSFMSLFNYLVYLGHFTYKINARIPVCGELMYDLMYLEWMDVWVEQLSNHSI